MTQERLQSTFRTSLTEIVTREHFLVLGMYRHGSKIAHIAERVECHQSFLKKGQVIGSHTVGLQHQQSLLYQHEYSDHKRHRNKRHQHGNRLPALQSTL